MTLHKSMLTAALLAVLAPSLSGCFPVVAAGVGTGVLMAEDRRTSGIYIEDEGIELKAGNRISEQLGQQVHINVTSFNRVVLLSGEAPTEELRQKAEAAAAGVPNVTRIHNEITIAAPSSLASRSNDAYLTSKVKARFIDAKKFGVNHVKVVTENGSVFLMGMVKHSEADAATEVARTTSGVQRVVRLFEYID